MSGRSKHILFVSLVVIKNLEKRGIYPDLIKYFISKGHHVTILSPIERRETSDAEIIKGPGYTNIRYKTLNNTKTNYVEKLASTLIIDYLIKRAIKNHVKNSIDILVCATPPITLTSTIAFVKNRFKVPCYLLLKDIFPDNIADLGLLSKNSLFYKAFRKKERKLYRLADYIGCMSPANVEYLTTHNKDLPKSKIEVNPNTINPIVPNQNSETREHLRSKYNVDPSSKVFFYGGNLGKPQMIPFLIEVLQSNISKKGAHFFIVGAGTDYHLLDKWVKKNNPQNVTLLSFVPKAEYDQLASVADVGFVLLDNRFKIPNFPNRILSYMENALPVLLTTDVNTDIGSIAVDNGFGLWAESGNIEATNRKIKEFIDMDYQEFEKMGKTGNTFLQNNYHISRSYNLILDKIP